jgi:dihydrofolate reductase
MPARRHDAKSASGFRFGYRPARLLTLQDVGGKSGQIGATRRRLQEQPGPDIGILGSGELVHSLMRHNLIDEYKLLIHPLVLGSGRRLFPDGGSLAKLRLTDSVTTTTGVVIATYQPADIKP